MSTLVSSLMADLGALIDPAASSELDGSGWTDAADLGRTAVVRPTVVGRPGGHALAVGIDLVTVSDVADSVERLGDRYLLRIFTPHELACCRAHSLPSGADGVRDGYAVEALAARFAAKEATVKVLRPIGVRPEWRTMEVHRVGSGWCELRLSGMAATMAAEAGIDQLVLSLTHEPTMAAAVVVGVRRDGLRTADPGQTNPSVTEKGE